MCKSVYSTHLAVIVVRARGDNTLEKLECKLRYLIDASVYVIKQTAAARVGTAQETAEADILNVESYGLVLDIPLLFKSKRELFDSLISLYVILLCKLTERLRRSPFHRNGIGRRA